MPNIKLLWLWKSHSWAIIKKKEKKKQHIIVLVVHSTRQEPSVSCQIECECMSIVRADSFISALCDWAPTHCCTWMYNCGCVITTGLTGLGKMTGIEWKEACRVSKHMHEHTGTATYTRMRCSGSVVVPGWQMKTDSLCVFYIMVNGFTFSRHCTVVHQGNVSCTLSAAVYLVKEANVLR